MNEKFHPLKFMNSSEKKRIENKLSQQFGIKNIPGTLISKGKEKLFLFSGALSPKDIKKIEENAIIEKVGVYFAKIVIDSRTSKEQIRLSIEGTHILKEQIKKNIFELNNEQLNKWMRGEELNIKTGKRGFLVMKYKDDYLGCGKASEEKITNFIPKNRRIREKLSELK